MTVQKLNQLLSIIRLSLHRILILSTDDEDVVVDHLLNLKGLRGGGAPPTKEVFLLLCGNFHLISSSRAVENLTVAAAAAANKSFSSK